MLKASAGGGGIGLRLVQDEAELKRLFSAAEQQAGASFGDRALFLERYVERARHIEVQIAADKFGNAIHLFERECTIQRRNQKVIEESPSPVLTDALRQSLCETAVRGAIEIGYTNVGTMEFIFDEETQGFFFLEMNTRLQVEHPVTEAITGLDLVELQIRLAAGEPLPLEQSDVRRPVMRWRGGSMQKIRSRTSLRLVPLRDCTLPEDGVRLDFGVEEGSADPLLRPDDRKSDCTRCR